MDESYNDKFTALEQKFIRMEKIVANNTMATRGIGLFMIVLICIYLVFIYWYVYMRMEKYEKLYEKIEKYEKQQSNIQNPIIIP